MRPADLGEVEGLLDKGSHLARSMRRAISSRLPDNPPDQCKRGTRIKKKSNLKPGDLVFLDENRNGRLQPWDHVGIYSGNGNLIHAPGYFGEVVESEMKKIKGYWGARRIRIQVKLHAR